MRTWRWSSSISCANSRLIKKEKNYKPKRRVGNENAVKIMADKKKRDKVSLRKPCPCSHYFHHFGHRFFVPFWCLALLFNFLHLLWNRNTKPKHLCFVSVRFYIFFFLFSFPIIYITTYIVYCYYYVIYAKETKKKKWYCLF